MNLPNRLDYFETKKKIIEGHARTCSSLGPRSREARFLLTNDGTKIKHRMSCETVRGS